MRGIHLVDLSVSGIKSLDKEAKLSFYKKSVSTSPNFQDYNIKGIYGTNGSGKTAIVSAVKILKDLQLNPHYLTNELNKHKLREMINKRTNKVRLQVEYLSEIAIRKTTMYRYTIEIAPSEMNTYHIVYESLDHKNAKDRGAEYKNLFEIKNGELTSINHVDEEVKAIFEKLTANLLSNSSMCSLFYSKIADKLEQLNNMIGSSELVHGCVTLFLFSDSLYVYLADKDHHDDYIMDDLKMKSSKAEGIKSYIKQINSYDLDNDFSIVAGRNLVKKNQIDEFKSRVGQLADFIQIFKHELLGIDTTYTEAEEDYVCRLILHYDGYEIDSEYESTGIKKLIELHQYIQKMCIGNIVFIDELDANIHDVYLCALLEYLSEFAAGQLCFTSHNIGPMRVLKGKKKSLDFLSVDKTIYSWTASGNYSPSTLYYNGMIKGSPFNVDMTDFIGVFEGEEI